MSTFQTFAVVGAGQVGGFAVDEFLKTNKDVTILTRDDTKADLLAYKSKGAKLAKVDYDDIESIKKALVGIDVVISTVGPFAMGIQDIVIRAAKAAGVQLFVPAEYGVDVTEGLNGQKKQMRDLLKQLDLPYALFLCSFFYDITAVTLLGDKFAEGKVQIVGDGKTKFTLTSRQEAGRIVAHVVSTSPKEDLAWVKIPIEGDRLSPLELAALTEKKYGKQNEITFVDVEEAKKNYFSDFNAFLQVLAADGRALYGADDVAAAKAKFFPDIKLTSYAEYLQ